MCVVSGRSSAGTAGAGVMSAPTVEVMAVPVGAVSDAAALHLPGGPASVGVEKVRAADVAGTIWLPKHAVRALSDSAQPPVPEGLG